MDFFTMNKKNKNFGGFWYISTKFWYGTTKLDILWVLSNVCMWKMAHVGQIFGPFLDLDSTKICQSIGFRIFSLKSFHWIHSKLDL